MNPRNWSESRGVEWVGSYVHFYRLLGLDIAQYSVWGPLTCRGWAEGGGMCSVDWPGQEGERELGVLGARVGA